MELSVSYDFLPKQPSLRCSMVMDHFGVLPDQGKHIIAQRLPLDVMPGDIAFFTGPSGSGKSSLMNHLATKLGEAGDVVCNLDKLPLPDRPLIDSLSCVISEAMDLFTACGLGEAQLLLRHPSELSDGQRYRFRLALALSQLNKCESPQSRWLVSDEFTATLDRLLAKVLAYNLRRVARKLGIGLLLATTHGDVAEDLSPDVSITLNLRQQITVERHTQPSKKPISFRDQCHITEGSKNDWPAFAQWHYRSHMLGIVRKVMLLKHGDEPIGICIFAAPARSLKLRNRYFGITGQANSLHLQWLNQQLWVLSRIVIHPTYRGAGLATWFVRESCKACLIPWIETLTAMGHIHPFFEKAGFVRIGIVHKEKQLSRTEYARIYGGQNITEETHRKSTYSEPVYYLFDNRGETSCHRN